MIKMIVVPIIVSTLIVGVAGTGDIKQLGKLGGKTMLYFQVVSLIAIVVGLSAANIFKPGEGIDMSTLAKGDIDQYVQTTEEVQNEGIMDVIVGIVPSNIVQSMANGRYASYYLLLGIIWFRDCSNR